MEEAMFQQLLKAAVHPHLHQFLWIYPHRFYGF